jgi:predicted nucleic acid-binding protein
VIPFHGEGPEEDGFLRGHGQGAPRVATGLESPSFATTAVTAFEIRPGAHSAKQRKAVDTLLAAMTILPFGDEEARIAADIRKELESEGQSIGMAGYLIAAICIANRGILLTRNWKRFQHAKDLELSGSIFREK